MLTLQVPHTTIPHHLIDWLLPRNQVDQAYRDLPRDPATRLPILQARPNLAQVTGYLFPGIPSGDGKIAVFAERNSRVALYAYQNYGQSPVPKNHPASEDGMIRALQKEGRIHRIGLDPSHGIGDCQQLIGACVFIFGCEFIEHLAPAEYERFATAVHGCLQPDGEFRGVITGITGTTPRYRTLKEEWEEKTKRALGALRRAGLVVESKEVTAGNAWPPWEGLLVSARKPARTVDTPQAKPTEPKPATPAAPAAHPLLAKLPPRSMAIQSAPAAILRPLPHADDIRFALLNSQSALTMLLFPPLPPVHVPSQQPPLVVVSAGQYAHQVAELLGASYHPGTFGQTEPSVIILAASDTPLSEAKATQYATMGIRIIPLHPRDFTEFCRKHERRAAVLVDLWDGDETKTFVRLMLAPGGILRVLFRAPDNASRVVRNPGRIPKTVNYAGDLVAAGAAESLALKLCKHEPYQVAQIHLRTSAWQGVLLLARRPDPVAQTLGEMQRGGAPDTYVPSIAARLGYRFGYAPDRIVTGGLGLGSLPDPNIRRDLGPWM